MKRLFLLTFLLSSCTPVFADTVATPSPWQLVSGNINRSSGNVGIGTPVPQSKLTVNGSIQTTGAGNVGINSLSPGQTLDVVGTVRALFYQNAFVPTNIQTFTTSGTWPRPSTVNQVYVKVFGPGGNGGTPSDSGGAGGGGGGGYAEGIIAVNGNVSVTISTTNSFAGVSTISATSGSNGAASGAGGAGGTGSGGTINLTGTAGGNVHHTANDNGTGGIGGGCPFGGSGGASGGFSGSGISPGAGGQYGGGGGGATNVQSGASGDAGAVVVMY